MVDGGLIIGFVLIFNWFSWKWGFWCIPSSVFCVVQPCRVLFFRRKTAPFRKIQMFNDFQIIFHQKGPNLLLTRGTIIKTGILTLIGFWCIPSSVFGLVQPCRYLPGAFFSLKNSTFAKKHDLLWFFYDFPQNRPNLLLTRGTTIRTGILTPIEFWWVP